MTLNEQYEEELRKIESKCLANGLEFNFLTATFPVIAKIAPTEEKKNQMVMDFGDEESNFVNGEIRLIFNDDLEIRIINDFSVSEKELNYIKNATKKLHYIFLQMNYKKQCELDAMLIKGRNK